MLFSIPTEVWCHNSVIPPGASSCGNCSGTLDIEHSLEWLTQHTCDWYKPVAGTRIWKIVRTAPLRPKDRILWSLYYLHFLPFINKSNKNCPTNFTGVLRRMQMTPWQTNPQSYSQALFPLAFLCLKYSYSKNPLQLGLATRPSSGQWDFGGRGGQLQVEPLGKLCKRKTLSWHADFTSFSPTLFSHRNQSNLLKWYSRSCHCIAETL